MLNACLFMHVFYFSLILSLKAIAINKILCSIPNQVIKIDLLFNFHVGMGWAASWLGPSWAEPNKPNGPHLARLEGEPILLGSSSARAQFQKLGLMGGPSWIVDEPKFGNFFPIFHWKSSVKLSEWCKIVIICHISNKLSIRFEFRRRIWGFWRSIISFCKNSGEKSGSRLGSARKRSAWKSSGLVVSRKKLARKARGSARAKFLKPELGPSPKKLARTHPYFHGFSLHTTTNIPKMFENFSISGTIWCHLFTQRPQGEFDQPTL